MCLSLFTFPFQLTPPFFMDISCYFTYFVVQVNSIGANVLEFVSDYGKPTAPLPAAIVACVPMKVHIEGKGETEFTISPSEITAAIEAGLKEPIAAEPEVSCLSFLLTLISWLYVKTF